MSSPPRRRRGSSISTGCPTAPGCSGSSGRASGSCWNRAAARLPWMTLTSWCSLRWQTTPSRAKAPESAPRQGRISVESSTSSLFHPPVAGQPQLSRKLLALERSERGAVQHRAVDSKACSVAGTIPALLGAVPVNVAAEVRAHGRQRVTLPVLVAVDSELLHAAADELALAPSDLEGGARVGRLEAAGSPGRRSRTSCSAPPWSGGRRG